MTRSSQHSLCVMQGASPQQSTSVSFFPGCSEPWMQSEQWAGWVHPGLPRWSGERERERPPSDPGEGDRPRTPPVCGEAARAPVGPWSSHACEGPLEAIMEGQRSSVWSGR